MYPVKSRLFDIVFIVKTVSLLTDYEGIKEVY